MLTVYKKDYTTKLLNEANIYLQNKCILAFKLNTTFLAINILDISNNNISFIPDIFSLKQLYCNNCHLRELPSYLPNLETLECKNNFIMSLHNYKKLQNINADQNLIHCLPQLPCLKNLSINSNPICEIQNTSLTALKVSDCPIISIHKLPSLNKRSSILQNKEISWIIIKTDYYDKKYIAIDWYEQKSNLSSKKVFTNKLLDYLFIKN